MLEPCFHYSDLLTWLVDTVNYSNKDKLPYSRHHDLAGQHDGQQDPISHKTSLCPVEKRCHIKKIQLEFTP